MPNNTPKAETIAPAETKAPARKFVHAQDFQVNGEDFIKDEPWVRPEGFPTSDDRMVADGFLKEE